MFRLLTKHRHRPIRKTRLNIEALADRALPSASPIHLGVGGILSIQGTPGDDVATVSMNAGNGNQLDVSLNATTQSFDLTKVHVKRIMFTGGAGNDTFTNNTAIRSTAIGGAGNDTLTGGMGADKLVGGAGDDKLSGGTGNDVLLGGAGDDQLDGGTGNDVCDGGGGSNTANGGPGKNFIRHAKASNLSGSEGDFWAKLTDSNGNPVGAAEIETETDEQGVVHTEVQLELRHAAPNTTLDLTIDPDGTGANVYSLGQVVTNDEGEACFEVTDPAGFPTLTSGAATITASDAATGGSDVYTGTLVAPNFKPVVATALTDTAGFKVGGAVFDLNHGEFRLGFMGGPPSTTYSVYVNGDATTGTLIGTVTSNEWGFAKFELSTDPNFPSVIDGSAVTVADAAGNSVLTGTFHTIDFGGGGGGEGGGPGGPPEPGGPGGGGW